MKTIAGTLVMIGLALALGVAGASAGAANCAGVPVTLAQARACQQPARDVAPVVRVDSGFDWGSAAIGAAAGAALLLGLGSSAVLLRRGRTSPAGM